MSGRQWRGQRREQKGGQRGKGGIMFWDDREAVGEGRGGGNEVDDRLKLEVEGYRGLRGKGERERTR